MNLVDDDTRRVESYIVICKQQPKEYTSPIGFTSGHEHKAKEMALFPIIFSVLDSLKYMNMELPKRYFLSSIPTFSICLNPSEYQTQSGLT
jgi:hypothetical protein